MPNVIDEVLGNRANGVVEQLGRQFGLDPTTTSSALSALLPALAAGVKSKALSAASVALAHECFGERRACPLCG
jgi:hypothetical protein